VIYDDDDGGGGGDDEWKIFREIQR